MSESLRITLLMDNRTEKTGLACEHGLSFLIQAGDRHVLFDCGASGAWLTNALHLGLDVSTTQHLVLSHGHRDHTGGLPAALQACPQAIPVFHPKALGTRFSRHPGATPKPLGLTSEAWTALAPRMPDALLATAPLNLAHGMGVTGPIPRIHPEEAWSGPFYADEEGKETDLLEDDQTLWIWTAKGLVLVTGCTHAGIVNTVAHVQRITGEKRIRAILGGLHLSQAPKARLQFTSKRLQTLGVDEIRPCHCTGETAEAWLAQSGIQTQPMGAGETWQL